MQLDEFDFSYPENLVAQKPLKERDRSKLFILDRKKEIFQTLDFYDIHHFFDEGDVLVVNDTRVLPARLFGEKETGGRVEVLLLSQVSENNWKCLVKPGKKVRIGQIIKIADGFTAEVVAMHQEVPILKFFYPGSWQSVLEKHGHMPLPPYIRREDTLDDKSQYQTVYAKESGAVAAPTAGLHFTKRVFQLLENKGVSIVPITLHVGFGTFQPVRVENITDHHMHSEHFKLSESTAIAINKAKRVICVGTTSVRALESSWVRGEVRPKEGCTDLFIYPGFKFNVVQGMLTNFHQPKSTLFMLTSAFAGLEKLQDAYQSAIAKKYRLFSYGDAMLII